MKIKPIYIYLSVFILVVLVLVITTNNDNNIKDESISEKVMPNDEVHANLKGNATSPSSNNVMQNIRTQLAELDKSVKENPNDTVIIKQYADLLANSHQAEKAIELYKSILEKDNKRIDVLLGLTYANYSIGEIDKAKEYTNKVLKLDNNHHEANYNLGAIAQRKGDNKKAIEIWQNVITKFPNSTVADLAKKAIENTSKN